MTEKTSSQGTKAATAKCATRFKEQWRDDGTTAKKKNKFCFTASLLVAAFVHLKNLQNATTTNRI